MKSISYSSSIYNTDNLPSVLESSFTLVKQFNCFTKDNLFVMIDKLERLKNEDFNRVHIPDFEYKVDGNILTYDTVFIKGWGVGTLIPYFTNIIYFFIPDEREQKEQIDKKINSCNQNLYKNVAIN